jgi:hypothetical protein
MGVYEPLEQFLEKRNFSEIPMTFKEVEHVLGRHLPQSAYKHRPWWANEAVGHSHAKAWLKAGYETTQVDMSARKLVFRRIAPKPGRVVSSTGSSLLEAGRDFTALPTGTSRRSPLFGALKGTFTIEPGYDLTRPALDPGEWEATLDAKLANFDKSRAPE